MWKTRLLGATIVLISASFPAHALEAAQTTSPDGKYLVSVVGGQMFVERLATHKRIRVGRSLPGPCCELVSDISNKGLDAAVEFREGAFWTKASLPWTKGRRLVLVRAIDTLWFLSMDGKLEGDV
ncbi:MAG: hypothetical protein M3Y55_02230 [Pseudomonadota bacterium]|nr:hypothetical protein [Pseudomonadota bacterium]